MGHKISKEQLDPGIKDHIMSFVGNVANLETEVNTDIISAVNSLIVNRVDNAETIGKLAEAIGKPVTATNTIDEVVDGLGEMLSTFKTNMMNSGVMVESGDKFKALIDKIKGLTEGEGNKGIRYAEGNAQQVSLETIKTNGIPVNIDFEPTLVFVEFRNRTTPSKPDSGYNAKKFVGILAVHAVDDGVPWCINFGDLTNPGASSSFYYRVYFNKGLNSNRITVKNVETGPSWTYGYPSTDYIWYAIGVGEEDTTLRDSLASILTDEGVSVTEEDDMASLITKVDKEFEDTRSKLAGLMKDGGYDITGSEDIDSLLELLTISGINLREIKQMVSMYQHNFVLKNDGTLWSCGHNGYGQLGLGTSDTNSHSTFTQVTTNINNDVKEVVCGYYHTFILKNDGSIWSCGNNTYGELGLGVTSEKHVFTQVTTNINNDVKQIACGRYYTFILKNDGSVWSCGDNNDGELGLGDVTGRKTFTKVNIDNVKQIVCGCNHTFILKNDGSLWACGHNGYGQLGLRDTTNKTTFTQVTTNINNDVKQIACGVDHVIILKNDGSVWSCGDNGNGQLGLGDKTVKTTFTKVTTNINNDVKEVVCGGYYTFILKNDGSVWGCGYNSHGELGLGDNTDKTTFTQIPRGIY